VKLSYSAGSLSVDVDCDATPDNHCQAMSAVVAFTNALMALEQAIGGKSLRVAVTGPTIKAEVKK
jgi:hypothetical protein